MNTSKNKWFNFLLIALFSMQLSMAQTYTNKTVNDKERIENENIARSILTSFGVDNSTNTRNFSIDGNSVFLKQIGDFNTVSVATSTVASEINVLQNGDGNDVNLKYRANTAVADLVQNGNDNKISDYVSNRSLDVSLELTQDGNGLIFERDGANELTKSLKFIQTEASPKLIIRSINN